MLASLGTVEFLEDFSFPASSRRIDLGRDRMLPLILRSVPPPDDFGGMLDSSVVGVRSFVRPTAGSPKKRA